MKLSLDNPDTEYRIDGYTPASILIKGRSYTSSLIITPRQIIENWQARSVTDMSLTDLEAVLSLELEVLLLGAGRTFQFPPPQLMAELAGLGIGLETMDTAAACRTFNILAAEGRKVGAALIIEKPTTRKSVYHEDHEAHED